MRGKKNLRIEMLQLFYLKQNHGIFERNTSWDFYWSVSLILESNRHVIFNQHLSGFPGSLVLPGSHHMTVS